MSRRVTPTDSRPLASRRSFLVASAGLMASGLSAFARAEGRPPVHAPRATDGDDRHEPIWDERFTLTVGQKQGDLIGRDDRVLQAAVDYVARLGGGTVQILPGTYTLRNSVFLPSGVRLRGSGPDSIITKGPSETIKLAADSDWYDQEITLAQPGPFRVGDGVVLRTKNPHNGSIDVIRRTLVARSGNRFKLDDGIRKNLWLSGEPTCSSLFPLLTSERTADVVIENLTLDGNKANNENLNGNYGGAIFLQDCNRYTIRGVEARNYNGDGISFQICHDVVVEDCHSHDNADLGLHPGSGSQRPLLKNNRLERNTIGLFWCWGVKFGLAENNTMAGNRNYGISIGHNDTDNVMRNNHVSDSGNVGILFRDDARGQDFWANRNLVEGNTVINSGDEAGVAIDVQGQTKDVRLIGNTIQETRQPMQRIGIRIAAEAGPVEVRDNAIEGVAEAIVDLRTS
ncbi:Pectate lyase superfamily protein [Maioricimonas rarisocia]|uniref:Pectate lyase superfamily protein n=1 Tax=Maioricimonas rarisocia TaxID=2528026 RepID=A0A517Z764_9PLAN|nr:right-handed parallel beta-helix repeat-containing protein [Maioricimonas rarisocia]QDU38327.1 Pectate lyase superfamily protein [Maioricimonas rarisocia]